MTAPSPWEPALEEEELPGLAGERTDLAWNRSSLSHAVLAAAVVRRTWSQNDDVTARVVVLCVLLAGAGVSLIAWWRSQRVTRNAIDGSGLIDEGTLRHVTIGALLTAGAALVLAALPFEE